MKRLKIGSSVLLLSFLSSPALAKVTQLEANKLGTELTQIGAQMAANKDGTIPSYEGGLTSNQEANPLSNIYAQEKPLFTITANNLSQYKHQLTDGQIALFEKYPDTYKMPVYQTHRTASYPKNIYNKAKKNATQAELVDGGNGMINFDETVPFAIPKNGLEVIWNHVSRYRGGSIERNLATLSVQRNGGFTPVKARAQLTSPHYLEDGFNQKEDDNVLFYYTQSIKSPARLTGNVLLVHETIDQVNQPRMAWAYNAGQRRVRRAPQIAYDAPAQASEGLRTSDQVDMYNGAPNKYNWKLLGKKEIYIPYNAYKLADPSKTYKDIAQVGHINQDLTRYELHRVWKVEATLKEGERHVYGKRTFYVDEDSWQIAIADHYDNRDILWRVSEGHALQFVNANAPWYVSTTNYDLLSGRYLVELNNEEKEPFKFGKMVKRKSFTASALRRSGKR
jgi:hypothetical protein